MIRTYFRSLLPALFSALVLAACSPATVSVTGGERDTVLAFAEPKTDAQLAALSNGDYTSFIKDYDEAMIKATTEQTFAQLRKTLSDKIGAYQSREVASVLKQGDFYIVVYNAKFEREDSVTMRVVFEIGGDHRIGGLWFDSPKLRQ
jgi:hypothetical protein